MPPAKTSSSSSKKTSSPATLMQSKLSFSVSRKDAAVAAAKGGKASVTASKTLQSPTPSVESSKASTPIEFNANSDKEKKQAGSHLAKKRKLDSGGEEVDVEEGKEVETSGVFKSREGVENTVVEVTEPAEPPAELNPNDQKWRKLYGQTREKMGNIEPVHPEKLNKVHHILRVFDLSYEYGPCVGVPRLQRWERADALGLNPPPEVKEILLSKQGLEKDEYAQNVFYGEI